MRKRKTQPIVEKALDYVGYTALSDNRSNFGPPGLNWDGAFINEVFRDTGYQVPNHQYTSSALAFYIRSGDIRTTPKPGDIVFFGYPPGNSQGLEAPHVGVISDVSSWRAHRTFKSVEGQTNTGLPRGPQEHNGVYERVRHESDVLAFVRPAQNLIRWRPMSRRLAPAIRTPHIRSWPGNSSGSESGPAIPVIRTSHLTKCVSPARAREAGPKIQKSVELVQLALAMHPGVRLQNADRGVFNLKTRRALSAFQRYNGQVNPDGTPDVSTLRMLADQTGNFFEVGE